MTVNLREIYNNTTPGMKNSISFFWGLVPPSIKYGRKYRAYERKLKKSQWWSRERHELFELNKIKNLVKYAGKNIPYYQTLFQTLGIDAEQITTIEQFQTLPFTDKDIIIEQGEKMVSKRISKFKLSIQTTGGTTGKQLRFYTKKDAYASREYPFINAIWGRVGYVRGKSKVAQLRNQVLPDGKLWEFDLKNRVLVFDTYHLTDENIQMILDKLEDWKAEYLHTYPSSVLILCDYIKRHGLRYQSNLKAILVTSENLYSGQKECIEEFFGARCFTFYGHSECSAIAGWCECSDQYHIQSEYGYVELIDKNGKIINEPNVIGEIVCTGFDNNAMPFIRYCTGDYSSYAENQECRCGRHYKLLNNIEGRWTQEMLVGIDGNKISMTAINMHSDIFKNVVNYQFVQNVPGSCLLKIIKNDVYSVVDEQNIRTELCAKFFGAIKIEFLYVSKIERTMRGKQRYIIQNIKEQIDDIL